MNHTGPPSPPPAQSHQPTSRALPRSSLPPDSGSSTALRDRVSSSGRGRGRSGIALVTRPGVIPRRVGEDADCRITGAVRRPDTSRPAMLSDLDHHGAVDTAELDEMHSTTIDAKFEHSQLPLHVTHTEAEAPNSQLGDNDSIDGDDRPFRLSSFREDSTVIDDDLKHIRQVSNV